MFKYILGKTPVSPSDCRGGVSVVQRKRVKILGLWAGLGEAVLGARRGCVPSEGCSWWADPPGMTLCGYKGLQGKGYWGLRAPQG